MGEDVHTLPEGDAVNGVTLLGDEVFVLRLKMERDQVEVYDVITYRLQRRMSLPNCRGVTDITSCEYYHCVYVADPSNMCIYRVKAQRGTTTWWAVNDMPAGLSVNKAHNVLVTCILVGKIKEFSSYGDLLRIMALPYDVIHPWHAIQLTSGQYVVCHGTDNDFRRRVCVLSADCSHIVHVHGGQPGRNIGQLNDPIRLAVDDNEFVFVADMRNQRVTLLSPTLNYVRQVVSRDNLNWYPIRLALDIQRRRLYVAENVADNEFEWSRWVSGRVVEFIV